MRIAQCITASYYVHVHENLIHVLTKLVFSKHPQDDVVLDDPIQKVNEVAFFTSIMFSQQSHEASEVRAI